MGLFGFLSPEGATQQASTNLAKAVNYNPQIVLGSASGNYMSNGTDTEQTPTTTASQEKKDTTDIGASLGLGIGGGSGSGGYVDKATNESGSGFTTGTAVNIAKYIPYAIAGISVIAAAVLLGRKK